MNGYLLDTHTLIWMQDDSELLSYKVQKILADSKATLHVSIVSFWEIVIKSSLKKIKIDYSIHDLGIACEINRIEILQIELSVLKKLHALPHLHKDPFDRLIASTAINYGLTLLTRDPNIVGYEVSTLW